MKLNFIIVIILFIIVILSIIITVYFIKIENHLKKIFNSQDNANNIKTLESNTIATMASSNSNFIEVDP